jgi:HEPN domain-containing protein
MAEKYLKALLQELGLVVPRTHDLDKLVVLLAPHHPALRRYRRTFMSLSRFAVDYRYPDENASRREAMSALRQAERIRLEVRSLLGLKR